MTKYVLVSIALTFFVFQSNASDSIKGINCGGERPGTLGAKLMISLVKAQENTYNVLLTRQSKDLKINVEKEIVAQGLSCEFAETDGAVPFILAECSGGNRMGPQHFSIVHNTSSSVRGNEWNNSITVQSPKIENLNDVRNEINGIFGDPKMMVIDVNLTGPDFPCRWIK